MKTNALMKLASNQIAVRVEGGFIVAAQRTVRLFFGPHLYCATKGTPRPDEKVVPYQPGYMLLAAALGATLTIPPSVRDPVTGQPIANPQVELVPGSSVIRSVRATAVCAARDAFGKWHASIQTITVDSESILRQALLKLDREDLVQVLSDADVQADRAEGKLRGWVVVPFMPGYSLAGKASVGPVREALQTYNNLSATIRQRACTKAERLACDHNPVMRMAWTYGDLKIDVRRKDGTVYQSTTLDGYRDGEAQISLPYVDVDCVSWTESQGQAAIDAFVQALLANQKVDGVETLLAGEAIEDGDGSVDEEIAGDDAPRQIAENPLPPAPVFAPAPVPVPTAVQDPIPAPIAAPAPAAAAIDASLLKKIRELEAALPASDLAWARKEVKLAEGQDIEAAPERAQAYRRALNDAFGGMK